jgi:hypothetical protein
VRVVRRTVGGGGGQFINLSVGALSDWVAPQLCFPRAAESIDLHVLASLFSTVSSAPALREWEHDEAGSQKSPW